MHRIQILLVCSVEPIGCGSGLVFFAWLSDLTFCVSFVKQTRIEFRNYTHASSSKLIWWFAFMTFSQRSSNSGSSAGGKSRSASELKMSVSKIVLSRRECDLKLVCDFHILILHENAHQWQISGQFENWSGIKKIQLLFMYHEQGMKLIHPHLDHMCMC